MGDGYPIEEETANSIERNKGWLKRWRYSSAVMLPHAGEAREAPEAGEIFRQAGPAPPLREVGDAQPQGLRPGKSPRGAGPGPPHPVLKPEGQPLDTHPKPK